MGMTKKLYMDWCEANDIEPDSAEAQAMQSADEWTKEFEQWLDQLSISSPLSENQLRQFELDFENKGGKQV